MFGRLLVSLFRDEPLFTLGGAVGLLLVLVSSTSVDNVSELFLNEGNTCINTSLSIVDSPLLDTSDFLTLSYCLITHEEYLLTNNTFLCVALALAVYCLYMLLSQMQCLKVG